VAVWAAGARCELVDPDDLAGEDGGAGAMYARAMINYLSRRRCLLCDERANTSVVVYPHALPPGAVTLAPFWADLCHGHFRDLHLEQSS
jgi:hypothetical protein